MFGVFVCLLHKLFWREYWQYACCRVLYAVYWEAVFELNRQSFVVYSKNFSCVFGTTAPAVELFKSSLFSFEVRGLLCAIFVNIKWLVGFFLKLKAIHADRFSLHICERNGMRYITSWYRRLLGSEILHQQQKVEEMLLFFSFLYLTGRCLQGAFTSQP